VRVCEKFDQRKALPEKGLLLTTHMMSIASVSPQTPKQAESLLTWANSAYVYWINQAYQRAKIAQAPKILFQSPLRNKNFPVYWRQKFINNN
jgi:hypothetical protein